MRGIDRASVIDATMPRLEAGIENLPVHQTLLIRLIRALDQSMNTFFARVITPLGLTESELHTLMLVYCSNGDSMTPGALCDLVAQTPANMTRILRSLEGEGLVDRSADPKDGRRNHIQITPAGAARIEGTLPQTIAPVVMAMGGLDAEEMQTFERLLRKAISSVDQATARLSL